MRTLVFVAAMFVASGALAGQQCLPAPTAKSLNAGCVYIQMTLAVKVNPVVTSAVDPKTVAAMPALPQVDTVVREVAVVE